MLSRKNISAPLKRKRVKLSESIHIRQKLKVKKKNYQVTLNLSQMKKIVGKTAWDLCLLLSFQEQLCLWGKPRTVSLQGRWHWEAISSGEARLGDALGLGLPCAEDDQVQVLTRTVSWVCKLTGKDSREEKAFHEIRYDKFPPNSARSTTQLPPNPLSALGWPLPSEAFLCRFSPALPLSALCPPDYSLWFLRNKKLLKKSTRNW